MRTYTFPQARPPGDGPWVSEPDKAQWVDPATGLDCLIVRAAATGALCGYVGVPPGHPLHGAHSDDPRVEDLAVHGGITFTGRCQEGAEDGYGICHVPEPGRPADVWWLGFDCGHAFDLSPTISYGIDWMLGVPLRPAILDVHYRTFEWVQAEVRSLAAQIAPITA